MQPNDTETTPNPNRKKLIAIGVGIAVIAICVISAILLVLFNFKLTEVEGDSMTPTIESGQMVASRRGASCERGDIVEYSRGSRTQSGVGRVIGINGDRIEFRDDQVYINGEADTTEIDTPTSMPTESVLGSEFTIPSGRCLILADNRSVGYDSRRIGLVDESDVEATIVLILPQS